MKKLNIFLIFTLIMIVFCFPVSAFFTESHIYWSLKGMKEVSSSITSMCGSEENMQAVFDGNTGSDIFVIHYYDKNKVSSYIATHTKGAGYQNCLENAGGDVGMRCFCVGEALHITQDHFSHEAGGLTPTTLNKFLASNHFGHMTVEKGFQDKHLELLADKKDKYYTNGDIDYYAAPSKNSVVCESFKDPKYTTLLKKMSGLGEDVENDIALFCSGYKNDGFFNTVYAKKVDFPASWYVLAFGSLIIGLGLGLAVVILGRNKWKWLLFAIFMLLAVFGGLLTYGYFTGQAWNIINTAVGIPAKFGYLSVSDSDVSLYNDRIQEATNKFLQTGQIPYNIVDASGRSHMVNGVWVTGALDAIDNVFNWFVYPIVLLFLTVLIVWLFYKTFKTD